MRYWQSTLPVGDVDGPAATMADGLDVAAAIGLVDALCTARFPDVLLRALRFGPRPDYLTAYRRTSAAPVSMRFSASLRGDDVATRCWQLYRAGPYLRDGLDDAATRTRADALGWWHLVADEIADPQHRNGVYRRHRLIDRLSIIESRGAGGWFAVNLFRVEGQGHFDDRDFAAAERVAPLLIAMARRHDASLHADESPAERLSAIERRLDARNAGLSARERAVCARLAIGMTYDGIAADLGIAATSAKTYRNRAFERLGIRYRTQLAPLCFGG